MKLNLNVLRVKKGLGEGAKKMLIRAAFPFRNRFLLMNFHNRAQKNRVNLNYWNEADNLGDAIAPVIVEHMLSVKGFTPDMPVKRGCHLYATGSVITAGIQDCTVWGSGILNTSLLYRLHKRKLDVRAVRGPETRIVLIDQGYAVPPVYGDPAILMPEIYTPKPAEKKARFGLVLHKNNYTPEYLRVIENTPEQKLIDIRTKDYRHFIDQIASVETVISTSLHGIILPESYGVPAILLQPTQSIFKHFDWYYSTGRYVFPIAKTLEEAKATLPAPLPDLDELRWGLRDSFPYDLYQG